MFCGDVHVIKFNPLKAKRLAQQYGLAFALPKPAVFVSMVGGWGGHFGDSGVRAEDPRLGEPNPREKPGRVQRDLHAHLACAAARALPARGVLVMLTPY